MKVLFVTSYPSPYRVDFFNLLGQSVDLTVAFTERIEWQKHRSRDWFNENYSGFRAVFLKDLVRIRKVMIFKDIIPLLKSGFDHIILGGYSSGTLMAAIEYMKLHRIPFAIEADGGMISEESKLKYWGKKHFIGSASAWLSSGKATSEYFVHYGAKKDRIFLYPFTSQWKKDLDQACLLSREEKDTVRGRLGIEESRMLLTVGQLIPRKGVDILMKAAKRLPKDVAVVVVGAEPTEEYLALKRDLDLANVHFVGFKVKDELADYYRAADVFVMPTRKDIWGLVINEAMSYGLPIVSTDRCIAALELVEEGVNGQIVPAEDPEALAEGILKVLDGDPARMGALSREKIRNYTMEKMVEAHLEYFQKVSS